MKTNKPVYLVLTAGVTASCTLFLVGLVAHFLGDDPSAIFTAATVTLLATPTAAVVTVFIFFLLHGERRGALLALILLAVIALSLLVGSTLRR